MRKSNDSLPVTAHTAEPWRIHRLSNGWPVIASDAHGIADLRMNGKGLPHVEANALRICTAVNACQGISTGALERNIIGKLYEVLQAAVASYERQTAPLADALAWAAKVRVILAEMAGGFPVEPRKPIVIEVHGGVVQGVLNVPPGYQYEINDYDSLEAAEKDAGRQQSPLDKWLEKCDMPQESEPTNRDRARWAGDALAVFTDATFSGDHPDTMHRDDLECAIGDLICDLLQLAHQKGFDPQVILEQGNAHFKTELLVDD